MKLIFIYYITFSDNDYDKFGLKYFNQRGFEIEVWSVQKIITGLEESDVFNKSTQNCIQVIDNVGEFETKVKENRDSLFWDFSSTADTAWIIRKILADNGCFYFWYFFGKGPMNSYERTIIRRVIEAYKKCKAYSMRGYLKRLWIGLLNKTTMKIQKYRENDSLNLYMESVLKNMPQFIFIGSETDIFYIPERLRNRTKEIFMHVPDYDEYLRCQEKIKELENEEEHIVFLDIAYVNHPDYALIGRRSPVGKTSKKYYRMMQRLFDKIEEEYGIPVIIAAHPRSNYKGDEFGKRRIEKGQTSYLVQKSKFVICHYSSSLNFAVLFDKPILMVYNKEMRKDIEWDYAFRSYADALGIRPFPLESKKSDLMQYIQKDEEKYQQFICKYIKSRNSVEDYSWNIMLELFEDIIGGTCR